MGQHYIKKKYLDDKYFDYFRAGLGAIIADEKNMVTAALISKKVRVSRAAITGILHRFKYRRKYPSMHMQIAITKYLGFDYLDFMAFGRALVEPDYEITMSTRTRISIDLALKILEQKKQLADELGETPAPGGEEEEQGHDYPVDKPVNGNSKAPDKVLPQNNFNLLEYKEIEKSWQ